MMEIFFFGERKWNLQIHIQQYMHKRSPQGIQNNAKKQKKSFNKILTYFTILCFEVKNPAINRLLIYLVNEIFKNGLQ